MKKILSIIVGIIILIIIIAIASGGDEQRGPEKIGETSKNEEVAEQPKAQKTKVYNLGDQVKLEDKIVTIYSLANYVESNEFLQPKYKNRYVSVDVSVENDGTEAINVNPFDFILQDSNSYSYDNAPTTKKPNLTLTTIQPGRKIRGFISYEVPKDALGFELIYTPNWLSSGQIIVNLGE